MHSDMSDSTSKQLAESYFKGLETFNALHDIEPQAVVTFSALVQTAMDPVDPDNKATLAQINSSITYRRQYRYVLETLSAGHFGLVAAASNQASVTQRDGENFMLRVDTVDSQDNDDVMVTLNILDVNSHTSSENTHGKPWLYLHCFYNDTVLPLKLKRQSESVYSTTCAKSSAQYQAICDINCEIFIH